MLATHSGIRHPLPCAGHIIALRDFVLMNFRAPPAKFRGSECAIIMLKIASRMDRLGTESAFEILAKAQTLAASGKSIVNLCIGQPDFPPPAHVIEAGQRAIAEGHHGYSAAPGILPLRESISADLGRRFDVQIDPPERWRLFQQGDWAVAVRSDGDTSFMITFKGRKSDMQDFVNGLH